VPGEAGNKAVRVYHETALERNGGLKIAEVPLGRKSALLGSLDEER